MTGIDRRATRGPEIASEKQAAFLPDHATSNRGVAAMKHITSRRMHVRLLVTCALVMTLNLASLSASLAQTARVPIYVSVTANDSVGQQLVYEIREQLNASNQLSSTLTDSDSAFQIKAVTLDPYRSLDGGSSSSTVYSVVLTMHDANNRQLSIFVDEWVGTCPAVQVQSCAASIVANVGNDVQTVLDALKTSLETPQQ